MIDRVKTCDSFYQFLNRIRGKSAEEIQKEELVIIMATGQRVVFTIKVDVAENIYFLHKNQA